MNKRLLTLSLLLIAACAGTGDASSTTAQPATTTATTAAIPTSAGGACVVGSWKLDLDSLVSSIEAGVSATGRTPALSILSGSASISFAENGAVSGVYDDLTIQTDLGEDSEPIDLVLAGQFAGTWSSQSQVLVLIPESESTLEATMILQGATGQTFEMGPELSAAMRSIPWPIERVVSVAPSNSAISCDGDSLTINPEVRGAGESVWLRS